VLICAVDNEFSQAPAYHAAYFAQLEAVYHASSIDVPLTYYDPGMGTSFINGTVGVFSGSYIPPLIRCFPITGRGRPLRVCFQSFNIHNPFTVLLSFDAYPQQYDCTNQSWRSVAINYHTYHETVNPSQPLFLPGTFSSIYFLITRSYPVSLRRIPKWSGR